MKNSNIHLWLVRFIGLIVPERLRADWQQEWEAELRWREQHLAQWDKLDWQHKLDLWRRSLGAFRDALLLQPQRWEDEMIQDLRFGIRVLRKHKGFTAVAVLMLALGIGATSAIFSVINGVLLKPLPYPQPDELIAVTFNAEKFGVTDTGISPAHYFIFREQNRTFQEFGIYRLGLRGKGGPLSVTGLGEPEPVIAFGVTDGLLPSLGVTPWIGRTFTREDDSPNSAERVILTYGYWNRKFGGDRSAIGKAIEIEGKAYTIIGVLPEGFRFLDQTDLAMFLPLKLNRAETHLGSFAYGGIARLKPGVMLEQANADAARMLPVVDKSFTPPPGLGMQFFEEMKLDAALRSLKQQVVGDVNKILWVLLGGISLVLIIACANLANLLLVRAEGRQQEFAIRVALGASRRRIAAQLFWESLILAVCGGVLGLGLAYIALQSLVALAPQGLPRLNEIGIDKNVLLFTFAVSLMASLLFGSVPVFKYAGTRFGIGLRAGGRGMSDSRERQHTRGLLVIMQVALALVLLVSSGLMMRTFRALTSVNPGFTAPAEVQTFGISFSEARVKEPERVIRIQEEILRKLEALPGVSSVGLGLGVPLDQSGYLSPSFAKDSAFVSGHNPTSLFQFVAPGYFNSLGTPLLAGRDYTWRETYAMAPVAIVSEKFARENWGDAVSALGKQIRATGQDDWREVIGVVGDVHHFGVDEVASSAIYWPMLRNNFGGNPGLNAVRPVKFSLRTSRAGSESLLNEVRQAVWSVAPYLPLAEVNTLNHYYTKSMARTSFTLVMLAVASGMGLFLGLVGLYGVIAYSVMQRQREIGIRVALGAQREDILRMMLQQGMKLVLFGLGFGLAASFATTRLLASQLFGVTANDPPTFIGVSLLLLSVTLLACYLPARNSTKVDPVIALRHE